MIDLRSARPGRRLFHLTSTQVSVPYGLDVVQVAPATLPIAFENSAIRIVQVRPSRRGPARRQATKSRRVTVDPATVEVIGPESSLRGLDEAMTEPVSVADATRPLREVVTIGVADPSVRLRTPQTATVTVQIVPGGTSRTFSNVPVTVRNLDNGLRGRADAGRGDGDAARHAQRDSRSLTPQLVAAEVDAAGAPAGQYRADVQMHSVQGVTVDSRDTSGRAAARHETVSLGWHGCQGSRQRGCDEAVWN